MRFDQPVLSPFARELVRIERHRCPDLHREFAPVGDRLHRDDLVRVHHSCTLHRRQSQRTATHHYDVIARLDARQILTSGQARAAGVGEHRQLRSRKVSEHRTGVFLGHHHQFADAAQGGHGLHRRSVGAIGNRMDVGSAQELAMIAASAQALVTDAALRGPRHDHPVADLGAFHLRADFDDAPHAAVVHDRRLPVVAVAQCERRDRIARHGGFGLDQDFARTDRTEGQLLDRDAGPIADQCLEAAARVRRTGYLGLRLGRSDLCGDSRGGGSLEPVASTGRAGCWGLFGRGRGWRFLGLGGLRHGKTCPVGYPMR